MSNFYGATSLIGGGAGALDAIDGAGLADCDGALVIDSDFFYIYSLDADSAAAEDSPDIITPDANAGDKRWIRTKGYNVIESLPVSGQYRIKNIRRGADGSIVVTYDGDAEP